MLMVCADELSKIAGVPATSWTPAKIHEMAAKIGVKTDNDPAFMRLCKKLTGKSHLDEMSGAELRLVASVLVLRGKRMAARNAKRK